jgi:hypothetical protein
MNSAEQAAGEKRVREQLVTPLLRRGLTKPASLTKDQFEDMVQDLCARLAYMSDVNLAALEEQAAASPSGKDQDRFPIANKLLEWAAVIQRPDESNSPLIRAVFAHELGKGAVRDDWAPELLVDLRKSRRWPTEFALKRILESAKGARDRQQNIERKLARAETVSVIDAGWRDKRIAAMRKCEGLVELEAKAS